MLVTAEEIENYYRGPWTEQRRERGLAVPPLADVRDEVRDAVRSSRLSDEINRWTTQLRTRASVDVFAWK